MGDIFVWGYFCLGIFCLGDIFVRGYYCGGYFGLGILLRVGRGYFVGDILAGILCPDTIYKSTFHNKNYGILGFSRAQFSIAMSMNAFLTFCIIMAKLTK